MRRMAVFCASLLIFGSTSAFALDKEPFSEQRFEALKDSGALVLIDIYATWCPTCAEQQKILERYLTDRTGAPLHILEVNYDEDKEWVRAFRAPRQSTLLLYRGDEQVWFSVAETREEVIFAALDEALAKR